MSSRRCIPDQVQYNLKDISCRRDMRTVRTFVHISMSLQALSIERPRFPHPTHEFRMILIRIACVGVNKDTVMIFEMSASWRVMSLLTSMVHD